MRCEDLNWLIAYAADELYFQGVVCDGRGDIYNKSANCPAVADLNVEWDFQSKTWRAEFVEGDFRGQKRCFSPSDHTDARWEKMQRILIPCTDSTLTDATPATKRKVAKEFVSHWCGSILRGDHAAFETEFCLTPS